MMFSIIALDIFKLKPEQNGYLMAYFGIVQMVRVVQTETHDRLIKTSVIGLLMVQQLVTSQMCLQVVQGGVIGPLTARYSERSLLLLSIGVSSLVGLAQVGTETHSNQMYSAPDQGDRFISFVPSLCLLS